MREVELHSLDTPSLARLGEDPAVYALEAELELGPHADLLQEVARRTLEFVRRQGIAPPWGGYLAVDPASRTVVGTCAFKGPPDPDGAVEIAYFTFPSYEGRGYATGMAAALRIRAAAMPGVRTVRAHTLPERNASARVLAKLGFRHLGLVQDPMEGAVWRWEWSVQAGEGTGNRSAGPPGGGPADSGNSSASRELA